MVVVAGSDKLVKTVEFAADGSSSVPHEMDAGIAVGHLCMTSTGATLFAACSEVGRTGCIRAYNYPLTGHYVEYQGHAGPIMRMRIAHDDSRPFTVGVDGALFIFDINEQAPSKKHSASIQGSKRSAEVPLAFAEEILVTKSNLEEKISLMNDLRAKVEE